MLIKSEIHKKVLVNVIIKHIIEVPENWNDYDIDFYMNESSHCLSNEITDIHIQHERLLHERPGYGCFCYRTTGEYIRDATDEDIENYGE